MTGSRTVAKARKAGPSPESCAASARATIVLDRVLM